MGSVVVWMSISLDGFIAGLDGELDWHMVDEELHQYVNDEIRKAGGFLNGRVNYELMAEFWPTADSDPNVTGAVRSSPASGVTCPKSSTRAPWNADWNSTIVRD